MVNFQCGYDLFFLVAQLGIWWLAFGMVMIVLWILMYLKDKKIEREVLDAIDKLSNKGYKIDIHEMSNMLTSRYTGNIDNLLNYYKRKGIIPFNIEFIDSDGYYSLIKKYPEE
ncbi:MAG: hypothetical protein NTZ60_09480 [Campylobacterales bacterium]|nr:hypothetical protein [Campylobacterales bacterium]